MRSKLMICAVALLSAVAVWYGCSGDDSTMTPENSNPPIEGQDGARLYSWAIGPIDGITTVWHPAPTEIAVPVGTRLLLECSDKPGSEVTWQNATEVRRAGRTSMAEFQVNAVGRHEIQVFVASAPTGGTKTKPGLEASSPLPAHTCVVVGIPASIADVGVSDLAVSVETFQLPAHPSNWELQKAYANNPANLVQTGMRTYRTAVGRLLDFRVKATDARLEGLVEVRIDDRRPQLATEVVTSLDKPGRHIVSVGPPKRAQEVVIETYAVSIAAEKGGSIPDNSSVTFMAHTDPPGYEGDVTWIAAARSGTVSPMIGHGPTFTTQFVDPWSSVQGSEQLSEWIGVRADNAALSQDVTTAKVTTFRIKAPGPNGKAAPCCLEYLYVRVHCPATASCDQGLGLAPTVTGGNTIATAIAYNNTGDAGDLASQIATGLTGTGVPASASFNVGLGLWEVTLALPPGCANAVCSFSSPTIQVNNCWPILTPFAPLNNVCYGGGTDERSAWVGGYRFEQ